MTGLTRSVAKALARAIRNDRGNSLALAFAITWGGLKLMRQLGARKRDVVYRTALAPGEAIRISNSPKGE